MRRRLHLSNFYSGNYNTTAIIQHIIGGACLTQKQMLKHIFVTLTFEISKYKTLHLKFYFFKL